MRRRNDTELVLNEVKLLLAAARLRSTGVEEFHGYQIGRYAAEIEGELLLSHGALYRALRRLEDRGALESHWEDPDTARNLGREGRPRRYYRITSHGLAAATAEMARARQAKKRPEWLTRWEQGQTPA